MQVNKKIIGSLLSLVILLIIVSVFDQLVENGSGEGLMAASILGREGINIYDGESASLLQGERSCVSYAEEVSPGRGGGGKALKLTPDPWHSSGYSVNCGGQDRLNFSSYGYIEFYIKGDTQSDGSHDFNIVSYYGTSKTVNLLQYIEGGKIDGTWRLVSIPLSDLKNSSYDLSTVDTIYFGSDSMSRVFYVDDIAVRNTKTRTSSTATASVPANTEPSVIKLYDGESSSAPLLYTDRSCVSYATEVSNGKSGKGLKLTPDAYHSPGLKINCGGRDRQNFKNYSALEFYLRGDSSDSNDPQLNVVSYYGQSNLISIKRYIDGGVIDTNWRLVSIPISVLKTGNYDLSTVDDIYFGTDSKNRNLYIDNLVVTKNRSTINTTPVVDTRRPTTPTSPPVVIAVQSPVSEPPARPQNIILRLRDLVNSVAVRTDVGPIRPEPVVPDPIMPEPVVPEVPIVPVVPGDGKITTKELYDYDEIDLANHFNQWLYAENKDYVSLNFVEKYDVSKVTTLSNYVITSANDSAYSVGRNPVSVSYRWRTIYAPTISKTDLKVAYRIFLKLPYGLKEGATYTVTAKNLGIQSEPFVFTYSDSNLNQNIKVNQIGYLPDRNKIAYVGQYAGTGGPMPFAISSFEVRDMSGRVVYTGTPRSRGVDVNNTGEIVYDLDFSNFRTPGEYVVRVPGVGTSYSFRIASDIYNEILGNAMKGSYHQRSGTSLTSEYTRFTHGLSHTKDGFVMDHNPIPQWFRNRFDAQGDTNRKDGQGKRLYYPTTLSGQEIVTTKGHYDAGDYGKYVVNGALYVGNLLAGFEAFPERLMKDDTHIPESGNNIPDLIDEVKWELDWLENMQDPLDGGVFCIVKPDGAIEYYENRLMDAISPSRRLLYPKDTTCTAAYAAALAKAGRSELIKKHYPNEAERYISKAKKAWEFLEKNPGYLGWHHYGVKDEFDADKSMDERVWAAAELYGATGDARYRDFFLNKHKPEYVRWGWHTLFEASGMANYACAFINRDLSSSMKDRCKTAIVKAADSHVIDSNNRAYRLSMSDSPLNYRDFTYFFPQERIVQLLVANVINPNQNYIQTALYNWDYILGANPTSYSFITGIGSKRFREAVSTQGTLDDIKAPISGIPIGMGNNFGYLEVYGQRLAQMYPPNNGGSPAPHISYPLLEQVYDGWNIGVEFTIPEIAQNLVSAAYFSTSDSGRNRAPSSVRISADKVSGPVPLTVQFDADARDSDGKIVRYFWDFDDETFSTLKDPLHTFTDPYKAYEVVLTVTDNDGAEARNEVLIRTSPATFTSSSDEYASDVNTLALFHLNDSSFKDDSGKNYKVNTFGGATLSSDNVLWMRNSNGKSLKFSSVNDVAEIELPRAAVFPSSGSTLVAEAKIFVESYLSLNVKSSNIFTLSQGDSREVGLYDAIYVDGTHVKVMDGYERQQKLLNSGAIAQLMAQNKMKTGTWFNFKIVIQGGKTMIYIDNEKVAESSVVPNFSASNEAIKLKFGGFKGYIDEIRISNVTR